MAAVVCLRFEQLGKMEFAVGAASLRREMLQITTGGSQSRDDTTYVRDALKVTRGFKVYNKCAREGGEFFSTPLTRVQPWVIGH